MVDERRAPGVQHGCDADASAQMLGVARNRHHGLGTRLEQQIVDYRLVLIGDLGDRRRHGEHHMVIRDRQQVGLPLGQPLLGRRALALRAMPIATANGELPLAALWANSVMGSWRAH